MWQPKIFNKRVVGTSSLIDKPSTPLKTHGDFERIKRETRKSVQSVCISNRLLESTTEYYSKSPSTANGFKISAWCMDMLVVAVVTPNGNKARRYLAEATGRSADSTDRCMPKAKPRV